VNDEIKSLLESLRRGQYEDPTEKISLLGAALREHNADVQLLTSLLRAPQIPLRLAAIDGCLGRGEKDLIAELVKLVDDPESRVREKLPPVLAGFQEGSVTEALKRLLQDTNDEVRSAALKSTAGRPRVRELHQTILESDTSWAVRLAAASSLGEQNHPGVVGPLFKALATDSDEDVARRCAELVEKRLLATRAAAEAHLPTEIALLSKAERTLKGLGKQRFPQLTQWITAQTTVKVDPEVLAKFGTDLTSLAEQGALPHAHCLEESCESVLKLLRRERWRSIALLGSAGTGKSALVNELVYQLATPENGGWRVLRISPSDFMAGTRYLGEWETKVRELIEVVKKPRRVIIYVPNLADLSAAGTWSRSDSSVATALSPYLEDGSLLLLGESTPDEFERGLGRNASLQRLFDRVLVPEASPETTQQILSAVRDEQQLPIEDAILRQLQETAAQFLSHVSRPGNAVALLRSVSQTAKEAGRPVAFRDILDSLSRSTGIPADFLDDSIPLSQADVRSFFERRIIGQPEAVDAVLDLITLIKAGLTDPQKPFGVMLFSGPTGVGKTELARSLAEYIFGTPARLLRLDMSEFASADGFVRLIGGQNDNGMLTDAVRQHPFSVVLLDEIEKSHVNVFDLCLQIFDAGRLTDGRGRTVDFRRTIVILTSNIGASAPTPGLGFLNKPDTVAAEVDKDRTFRELTRFFRPEFLNRIDRIVQFRPLSLEVAEQIARRELDLVLRRSGLRRRDLAVEVEPSVISLLVREGYSPHFGARPLKRTVERFVLLPLARAIASGSVEPRAILHLTHNTGRIEVTITRPPTAPKPEQPRPSAQQLLTETFQGRCAGLLEAFAELDSQLRPLADRKSELLLKTQESGFYQDAVARTATFDEIHKLDQFLALRDGLGKALRALRERLQHHAPTPAEEPATTDRLDQLAAELDQLRFIASSKDARDLGDVLLCLTLVERHGQQIGAVEKLTRMYQALADRRRMTSEVLGEWVAEKHDSVWLAISGLGAYALLKNESGLHQLDHRVRERKPRTGREAVREDRETIRIEALPVGSGPTKAFSQAVKTKISALKPPHSRLLEKADLRVSLFHEPSLRSLELWSTSPRHTALDHSLLILHTLLNAGSDTTPSRAGLIIRHYDLGISPRIKDTRSGRSTSRIDRVFKGHLDALLVQ
jgi:ATP-dependent Clp protease ATP-binding subunit ClpC